MLRRETGHDTCTSALIRKSQIVKSCLATCTISGWDKIAVKFAVTVRATHYTVLKWAYGRRARKLVGDYQPTKRRKHSCLLLYLSHGSSPALTFPTVRRL